MKPQLSIGEAALRLGLSVDTVRQLELSGQLRATRTAGGHRRFSAADIDAFLKRRAVTRHPATPRRQPPAPPRKRTRRPTSLPRVPYARAEEQADDESWESLLPGNREETRVIPRQPRRAAAAVSPEDGESERWAQALAEQTRLTVLKQYGRILVPNDASPALESEIIETLDRYVTGERFPPTAPLYGAHDAIRAKVEALLEPHAAEKRREAREEASEQRIETLIEHGRARASRATMSWDSDDRDEARADVQDELEDRVDGDWTESEVDELVDDVLAEWEEADD
jgi:excisionase family DNA binding protein